MEHKDLNRLKLILVEKKRTGVWLAEQLGVTAVTVSKWCSNITQPTLPMLDKTSEILECDIRDLITNNSNAIKHEFKSPSPTTRWSNVIKLK